MYAGHGVRQGALCYRHRGRGCRSRSVGVRDDLVGGGLWTVAVVRRRLVDVGGREGHLVSVGGHG